MSNLRNVVYLSKAQYQALVDGEPISGYGYLSAEDLYITPSENVVSGPATSIANGIATFSDTAGNLLLSPNATLTPAGTLTATTFKTASGSATGPTYTFTADSMAGLYYESAAVKTTVNGNEQFAVYNGSIYANTSLTVGSPSERTAYNAGTAYSVGTVVTYNNKIYICRKATTAGTAPTTTANWVEASLDNRGNALIGPANAATIWNNGSDLVLESDTGNLNFVATGNVPLRIFSHIATAGGIQSGASVPFHFNVLSSTEQAIGAFSDYTGSAWRARGASVGLIKFENGAWNITSETGKSVGGTYTPTSRLFIKSDGNVGIGTTSPYNTLTVQKTNTGGMGASLALVNYGTSGTAGTAASIDFGLENSTYSDGQSNAQIKAVLEGANNSSSLVFSTYNGGAFGERLKIAGSGAVTISNLSSTGFVKSTAGLLSVDTSTYLTAESDTLDSVTDRNATTTNAITVGGITTSGLINFNTVSTSNGFLWNVNSDLAGINFKNTGDGDTNSHLNIFTQDNGNEYIKFSHQHYSTGNLDYMDIKNGVVRVNGDIYVNAEQSGVYASGTNTLINGSKVATDSSVVHIAQTETITGLKTFTNPITTGSAGQTWVVDGSGTNLLFQSGSTPTTRFSISNAGEVTIPALAGTGGVLDVDANGKLIVHTGSFATSVTLSGGTGNGTLKLTVNGVTGSDVSVTGLGSAAYTASTAYATSTQGSTADTAIQSGSFAGTPFTKTGTALSITQANARTALGLGSAAYTASTDYRGSSWVPTLDNVTDTASITTNGITTSAYNMGTTSATTTKATMQYNATTQSVEFIFA